MKLYLDNSFLNRPFDNLEVGESRLEAEVLFLIIKMAKRTKLGLVNSSVIEYENSLNPFPERKVFVEKMMKLAKFYQNLNEEIKKRAEELGRKRKLQPIDALHVASAEKAAVDFFITCDYNLIKKYQGKLKVINPLKFLEYYENPS